MLTAVVPLYNEEASIQSFHRSLLAQGILDSVIYVDDGSTDHTLRHLRQIRSVPSLIAVQYVSLGRNYGKEIALLCGLDHCDNDSDIVVLDGDGQHPPEEIENLYNYLCSDVDVVFAARSIRTYQNDFDRLLSKRYYWLIRLATGIAIDDELGDFFCAKSHYAHALRLYRSPSLFFKCIYPDIGFRIQKVPVTFSQEQRPSRFGTRKKLSIASSSLLYTSGLPLRVIAPLGALISVFSILALLVILIQYIAGSNSPPGYFTLVFLINFYSGIVILFLGIVARYLELIMRDALRKPVYTIKERRLLDD